MIEFTQAGKKCKALTAEEADSEGIDYVYWKDCPPRESGHILTDDGFVLALQYCREYPDSNDNPRRVIKAEGAFKWISKAGVLNFMDYHNEGIYTKTNPKKDWMDAEISRTRTQEAIDVLAVSFIATGKFDWKRAAQVYRPDQKIPEATLRRLFRNSKVRTMLNDRLKEQYDKLGFDEEFTITAIKEAYDIAKKNEDALNMLRVAEKGIELLGMTPGKITETRAETLSDGNHMLERAQSYRKSIGNGRE